MTASPFPPDGLELGLGLLAMGRSWGVAGAAPPSDADAMQLLETAFGLGIRVLDTAPAYGSSERRLGRFLSGLAAAQRERLVVMTKAGENWDPDAGSTVDHSADGLRRSIDASLALLGRIDVLQIHKATVDNVASDGVAKAIAYAKTCGVRWFGASVPDLATGEAAIAAGLYDTLQFPLNAAAATLAPLAGDIASAGGFAIVNRPFAMGASVAQAGDPAGPAREAFRFVGAHVPRGVVLTGTGKAAHLIENEAAFRQAMAVHA